MSQLSETHKRRRIRTLRSLIDLRTSSWLWGWVEGITDKRSNRHAHAVHTALTTVALIVAYPDLAKELRELARRAMDRNEAPPVVPPMVPRGVVVEQIAAAEGR